MKRTLSIYTLVLPMLFLTGCGGGTTSVQKTTVRVEPYTNSQGQRQQMVYVDWKNTGTTPVRFVVADLSFYNATGTMVDGKGLIYVVPAGDVGIAASALDGGSPYERLRQKVDL